jgi:MFS family permease
MIVIQGALLDGLTRRFGLLNVLSFGAMIFAVSLLAAPMMWGEFDRALVILTAFTGATCCLPILNTIASSVVPDEQRGRMMGVTTMAASLGRVAGPLITGLVLTVGGYSWSWVILALPVLAVWVWSRSGARRYASINRAG